jgi:hypothetical protein
MFAKSKRKKVLTLKKTPRSYFLSGHDSAFLLKGFDDGFV